MNHRITVGYSEALESHIQMEIIKGASAAIGYSYHVFQNGKEVASFSRSDMFFRFMANQVFQQTLDVAVRGNIESTNHY